jgi:dihydroorotase
MDSIEITQPDDWHLHLRDEKMLARVLPYTARRFRRAIVMPNLDPPVTTVADASSYRNRILGALPPGLNFEPLMTLYLTDATATSEIEAAAASSIIAGVKFYPMGATTNSARGVETLAALYPVLEALERSGLPLLIHGEATSPDCDVFDRERVFLDGTLRPLVDRFEGLRIVFEHITTKEAAAFVQEMPARVAATITPQHLLLNRNAIFEGGLRPHHYCLPVLKRESDREALVRAAVSGDPSFFLGTDSAPHERGEKESACGCAGIFSAPIAIEAYAEAFFRAGALDRLEGFASFYGADFYRRPRNEGRIRLTRRDWQGPDRDGHGPDSLEIF